MEAELGKRRKQMLGEEASMWSNAGVISNRVTTKLYILIRHNSDTISSQAPLLSYLDALIIHANNTHILLPNNLT